jgi:hypothetical protein
MINNKISFIILTFLPAALGLYLYGALRDEMTGPEPGVIIIIIIILITVIVLYPDLNSSL